MTAAGDDSATVPEWLRLPGHLGITTALGPCPESLDGGRAVVPGVQVNDTEALVHFAAWSLHVRDGQHATIDWHADLGREGPAWVAESWAVPLAMFQRGYLCLHASVVCVDGTAVGIAGISGAGKSTTAMALRSRGHDLLTDDVAIVDVRDENSWVLPYRRNVHLLADSAAELGIDFGALPPLVGFPRKAAFRPDDVEAHPRRLGMLIALVPEHGDGPTQMSTPRGRDRLAAVLEHAARTRSGAAILGEGGHFGALAQFSRVTPIHVLRRPTMRWSTDEVVALIESAVASGGER